MEAHKDGLDVIAITEHLEYQSWIDDIPHPDKNRSYELAKGFAKKFKSSSIERFRDYEEYATRAWERNFYKRCK
tara:strand:- start:275 stop:496 length:222 start_codon:yes stop_codon:yes gene_type:complete